MIKFALASVMLLSAASAHATTYDVVADFSSTPTVFSYGTGVTGFSFTPDSEFNAVCEGDARISCFQTPTPVARVPFVAKNITGSTVATYGTVVFPTDVLNVHPGPSTDSIVRFTAQTGGTYKIDGRFELLDVSPSGVNVAIFAGGINQFASTLTGPAATFPGTPGGAVSFNKTVALKAGQTIDFGVNNAGNFGNDSTGLAATITSAVPEPSSWAMMIGGFGIVGGLLRSKRRQPVAALRTA